MTEPEAVKITQLEAKHLINGAAQGGMGAFELGVPAGSNVPPPHSLAHNEDCVCLLEGTLRHSVDGARPDQIGRSMEIGGRSPLWACSK